VLNPAPRHGGSSADAARTETADAADDEFGVFRSPAMIAMLETVKRIAPLNIMILLTGESGTGKELIARAIHATSSRRHRRFCAVNCAALSDDLFETELFGHTRGAFTGATSDRPGLFEEADGGTLFLDEVGELSPPLRGRPEDIAAMARLFWKEAMKRTGGRAELAPAALARYHWPGNVRELQNAIATLSVHAPPRGRVGPSRLPAVIAGSRAEAATESMTLGLARRRFEERFVRATLARTSGRRSHAAAALGLTRQGLAKLMTRLGIGDADGGEGAAPPGL